MTEWIEWKGGECPVGDNELVEIMFSRGGTAIGSNFHWYWHLNGAGGDIVKYRLVDGKKTTKHRSVEEDMKFVVDNIVEHLREEILEAMSKMKPEKEIVYVKERRVHTKAQATKYDKMMFNGKSVTLEEFAKLRDVPISTLRSQKRRGCTDSDMVELSLKKRNKKRV